MSQEAIFYPAAALVLLTLLVLLLVPYRRFKAAFARQVNAGDFRYGESPRVPGHVSLPNRNYMNLLELPVLFYVVCLVAHAAGTATPTIVALAWSFVALRIVHSLVQVLVNHILARFAIFFVSSLVLWALALKAALRVF